MASLARQYSCQSDTDDPDHDVIGMLNNIICKWYVEMKGNETCGGGTTRLQPPENIGVASFFSGIGGFDLGFESAGMKVVFQCENNDFCRRVLKKHWLGVPLAGDIRHIKIHDIPKGARIWCAGFPCQDVSLANQGKRKGLDGDRSGLFFAFTDLVAARKPDLVVLENVTGLLNSNEGEDFRSVIGTLDKLGYVCAWRVFDAQYFGTSQRRRRIIVVASLRNTSAAEILLDPDTVVPVLEKSDDQGGSDARRDDRGNQSPDYVSIQHGCIGRSATAGPQGKGWRIDGKTWTLDSRGTADVVCSTINPFGVREASGVPGRLDGSRYRAIGNAIPVQISTWLGVRIVNVLSGNADYT